MHVKCATARQCSFPFNLVIISSFPTLTMMQASTVIVVISEMHVLIPFHGSSSRLAVLLPAPPPSNAFWPPPIHYDDHSNISLKPSRHSLIMKIFLKMCWRDKRIIRIPFKHLMILTTHQMKDLWRGLLSAPYDFFRPDSSSTLWRKLGWRRLHDFFYKFFSWIVPE